MKRRFSVPTPGQTGFTLVELLVAMTILSIMLVGLAAMMSFVLKTWLAGINSVDNFTKARVVMNLLDRDIQMMVLRRDLAAFVDSTGNNPACAFYTNVQGNPGSSARDTRAISLVNYLLDPSVAVSATAAPAFLRYNYGMNFPTVSGSPKPIRLSIGTTNSLPIPTDSTGANATLQSDTVFNGIIQFRWQFVDGTGTVLTPPYATLSSTPPSTSFPPMLPTPFWFDFANPSGTYNPRVVVISMVVLSNSAYKLAVQTGNVQNVVSCFSSVNAPLTGTNPVYSQAWNMVLTSPNTTFLALPAPVRDRGAIQVFERHIPLPINL